MTTEEAIKILDPETSHNALVEMMGGTWNQSRAMELLQEAQRMGLQALRKKQTGGWISVEERLPETETPVLVTYIATDGEIHSDGVAALLFGPYWYWWEGSVEDTDQEVLVEITHWQPLSEPPKGE